MRKALFFVLLGFQLNLALASFSASGSDIHAAVRSGDIATIRYLLLSDPGLVNASDKSGSTPLHFAAAHGQLEVVKLLLAAKADVRAVTSHGNSPLHRAAREGHADIVELLLANGEEANA